MLGLSNVEEGGREGGRTAVVKAAGGAGRGESVGTLLRVTSPPPSSLPVCLSLPLSIGPAIALATA